MLFVEARFFAFLAIVMLLYWGVLRGRRQRHVFLLASSYLFYAAWDWRFLGLIVLSSAVDYVVALRLVQSASQAARKGWLLASLLVNLGMLGVFKYAGFFVDSLTGILEAVGLGVSQTTLNITLPVGISFFTFQTLSYTIDVYRGTLAPRRNFLEIATFVAFFPQLVAGPIVRAAHFLPQMDTPRSWRLIPWRQAGTLMVIGFIKKAVIADSLAVEVDNVFADPGAHSSLAVAEGVVMYAAQIYCDFSGYSDMAIAIALMLGYSLTDNFRWPYLSSNITEFWRRWHISLSTWLRDYLYISLGGNRGGLSRTRRNLMLTMLLGGLWHGAGWNFVVWGGLHGVALVLHRWWSTHRTGSPGLGAVGRVGGTALTFTFVCAAWIFFRATDLAHALDVIVRILAFDSHGEALPSASLWLLCAAAIGHATVARHHERLRRCLPDPAYALALGILAGLAVALVPLGNRPFIYFQF